MKVAVFLAEGFEEVEAISIIDVLRRGEVNTHVISVTGEEFIEGGHGIVVQSDLLFEEVDFDQYQALVLPGGMPGTRNLQSHQGLIELILKFHEAEQWLCAICAAPSIFGDLGILRGQTAICYPGFEKELEGAEISDGEIVVSNHFITGKGPGLALEFALTILEQIKSFEAAAQIRKGLLAD